MGFLTRLLAGLLAASTLGTGLAGTANAVDAAGAASDATGAVTTTADDTGGRTVLDCRQSGEGATGPYADKFCWIDWSNLPLDSSGKPTPVRINVPGGHIDADATVTHTDNAALTAKDFTGNKWSRLTPAYRLTVTPLSLSTTFKAIVRIRWRLSCFPTLRPSPIKPPRA